MAIPLNHLYKSAKKEYNKKKKGKELSKMAKKRKITLSEFLNDFGTEEKCR